MRLAVFVCGEAFRRPSTKGARMTIEELLGIIPQERQAEVVEYFDNGFFKDFISTPKGKQVFKSQVEKDGEPIWQDKINKGIETWKKNNLGNEIAKGINEEIKRRFPDQDPVSKRLNELEAKIAERDQIIEREKLRSRLYELGASENIPKFLLDKFSGQTEDEAAIYIHDAKEFLRSYGSSERKSALSGQAPIGSKPSDEKKLTLNELRGMSREELMALEKAGKLNDYIASAQKG